MQVTPQVVPDVLLIEPKVFGDARGFFKETYSSARYVEAGLPPTFVQDNLSKSGHGILRGLHLQHPRAQGKLVSVVEGSVYDVAVDVRVGSPHFGKSVGVELSADNHRQLYIPPGFAHGFCVTSDSALFHYKCTEYYAPECEHGVLWNDPALGIDWPIAEPRLSDKDRDYPVLADIDPDTLPRYQP